MDSKRYASPAGFALALILFALPFLNVSCAGQTKSLTGFNLITGVKDVLGVGQYASAFGGSGAASQAPAVGAQPVVIFAFLVCILGLVLGLLDIPNKERASSALAGFAFLLMLGIGFGGQAKVASQAKALTGGFGGDVVKASWGSGLMLELVVLGGLVALNLWLSQQPATSAAPAYRPPAGYAPPVQPPAGYAPPSGYAPQAPAATPPAPSATPAFCGSCGGALTQGVQFCPSCGGKV